MKIILVLAAVFIAVQAGPLPSSKSDDVEQAISDIVYYSNDNAGIGPYNFGYETSDGQKREEHAQIVIENEEPTQVIKGSYSYIGPDGITYTVNYTADKNGYHPQAAHIPQPPQPTI